MADCWSKEREKESQLSQQDKHRERQKELSGEHVTTAAKLDTDQQAVTQRRAKVEEASAKKTKDHGDGQEKCFKSTIKAKNGNKQEQTPEASKVP